MKINRVAVLGNKDHGKSTLIGNLMISTGSTSQQRITDAKEASARFGQRFEPAFILDSFMEERKGGFTLDSTRVQMVHGGRAFEFIDLPGHEELMKNMLSGASNAESAIVLISADPKEGISEQTMRHVFLASMLGMGSLTFAVNKMDAAGYSQQAFEEIKARMSSFISGIGFSGRSAFVPISAYASENLIRLSRNMPWYSGQSLMQTLAYGSRSQVRNRKDPLRLSIQGTLDGGLLIGKMLSGSLRQGQSVVSMPQSVKGKVSKLYVGNKPAKSAIAGQNVAIRTDMKANPPIPGSVVYGAKSAPSFGDSFSAMVFATSRLGNDVEMRVNGTSVPCRMQAGHYLYPLNVRPRSGGVKPLCAARVTITPSRPIVAEPFRKSRELGRFSIYCHDRFAGIGIML